MDVSVQESFRALTRCMYELLEVNDEEMLSFEAVFAQISKVDPTLVTNWDYLERSSRFRRRQRVCCCARCGRLLMHRLVLEFGRASLHVLAVAALKAKHDRAPNPKGPLPMTAPAGSPVACMRCYFCGASAMTRFRISFSCSRRRKCCFESHCRRSAVRYVRRVLLVSVRCVHHAVCALCVRLCFDVVLAGGAPMSSVAASNAAADTPARPVQSQRDTADKGGGTFFW
jgi:hypothetical protein